MNFTHQISTLVNIIKTVANYFAFEYTILHLAAAVISPLLSLAVRPDLCKFYEHTNADFSADSVQ